MAKIVLRIWITLNSFPFRKHILGHFHPDDNGRISSRVLRYWWSRSIRNRLSISNKTHSRNECLLVVSQPNRLHFGGMKLTGHMITAFVLQYWNVAARALLSGLFDQPLALLFLFRCPFSLSGIMLRTSEASMPWHLVYEAGFEVT